MHNDQSFDDIIRECRLDPDEFNDIFFRNAEYPSSGQRSAYQFSDYGDQIEDSSPSPPERYSESRLVPYAHRPVSRYEENGRNQQLLSNAFVLRSHGRELDARTGSTSYGFDSTNTNYNPRTPNVPQIRGHQFQAPSRYGNSVPVGQRTQFQASEPQSTYSRSSISCDSHGIRLRPVSELPDMQRGIFKFGVFNAVQSTCFDMVLHSDENLVISAPTGSGKTVLFELSILRMMTATRTPVKCVYMAPTKALCSERYRDWTAKFESLGLKCCELTGDTVTFGKGAWGDAMNASIILVSPVTVFIICALRITTGEKWDSLTRHWREHDQILSQIQLFLVDEVHILNESRGSTLEVVISRMKARGSAVRFLLVSATAPNIEDIANWIGAAGLDGPAKIFEFGENFRPCKLTRFVYGIPRNKNQNDFVYAKMLDYRLFPVLQQHAENKPILVFVATRKGVFTTAEQLTKEYQEAADKKQSLPWSRPIRIDHTFHDKRLGGFAIAGIGVHHAGLTLDDRRTVEDLYLKGVLRVIISTSTLAVGVNLPAHTVVIKGVHIFQNNTSVEYSDLDVMQMLGRAGRPQFDKDGVAIILCETELEAKYKSLLQGKTILESCLHLNLSEHINSEVGLGTITSINSAKDWLRDSFLYWRIQKNPKHYALGKGHNQTWEDRIDDMVMQSVTKLQQTELVEYTGEGNGGLASTEYGDIMSKFYIRQSTMGLILALPPRATLREILEIISASEEQVSESKLRTSEKTIYNKLRVHNDIRFEMKKIEKTSDKVFVLIQAVLGGIPLNAPEYRSGDSQPQLEAYSIFRHIPRITRAIVEVAIVRKLGAQIKHGLELARCLMAKAWEDRPVVLRQIEQIGEKSIKILAENGVTSLEILRKQDHMRIEALLNRRPPFGLEILASANELPSYFINVSEVEVCSSAGEKPIEARISIECGLVTLTTTSKKQKGRGIDMTAVLVLTSDLDFIDFRRIATKSLREPKTFEVTAQLTKPSQTVTVYITSESVAGVTLSRTYKPTINAKEYPTPNTRPLNPTDMDLLELEDDPNFWDMYIDDSDEQSIPMKDLTKQPSRNKVQPESSRKPTRMPTPSIPYYSPNKPKKRPNGTYECNHPCADKAKCRHLCCRDGVPEPRPLKKVNAATTKAPPHESTSTNIVHIIPSGDKNRMKNKSKSNKPQLDRRLEQLESLHERTNSMKMSGGQRLKLDSPEKAKGKRKRKPVPNFDIDFTDLTDGDSKAHTSQIPPDDNLNDDDDLPEPCELLKPPQQGTSSPSNYSNSELEALICNAPVDDGQYHGEPVGVVRAKHQTPTIRRSRSLSIETPPVAHIRQDTGRVTKRARLDSTRVTQITRAGKTRQGSMNEKQQDPLFLPQSLMRGDNCGFSQDVEDDFPLVFDSVYVLPDTPGLTASTRASDDGEKKAFRNSPPTQDEPRSIRAKTNSPNPQTKTNHIEKKTKNVLDFSAIFAEDMAKANGRGDFEALKAYFWSGAVDVID